MQRRTADSQAPVLRNLEPAGGGHETHLQLDRTCDKQSTASSTVTITITMHLSKSEFFTINQLNVKDVAVDYFSNEVVCQ